MPPGHLKVLDAVPGAKSIVEVDEAGRLALGKGGNGCEVDEKVVLNSPGLSISKVKSKGVSKSVERNRTLQSKGPDTFS
jgi:hypothetical protein